MHLKEGGALSGRAVSEKQSGIQGAESDSSVDVSPNEELGSSGAAKFERNCADISPDMPETRASSKEMQETKLPPPKSVKLVNCVDGVSHSSKLTKMKSSHTYKGVDCRSQLPNGKMIISDDVQPAKFSYKKSMRRVASAGVLAMDASKARSSPSSSCARLDSVTNDKQDDSRLFKGKEARSLSFDASGDHPQDACKELKKSVWRKVQQFRSSKQSHNYKVIYIL